MQRFFSHRCNAALDQALLQRISNGRAEGDLLGRPHGRPIGPCAGRLARERACARAGGGAGGGGEREAVTLRWGLGFFCKIQSAQLDLPFPKAFSWPLKRCAST